MKSISDPVSSQDRPADRARLGATEETSAAHFGDDADTRRASVTIPSPPARTAAVPVHAESRSGRRTRSDTLANVRVAVLSAMLAFTAAALVVWGPAAGLGADRGHVSQVAIAALVIVLSAAAVSAPVSFHHRGHTYLFSLGEVPLLLGLVFATPVVLVTGRVVGNAIGYGAVRRQSPLKLTFNLASTAFVAAAAMTVYREILGTHSAIGPYGWLAGAAALAVAAMISHGTVVLVVRVHGGNRQRPARFDFFTWGLLLLASIGLAFVVLDAAAENSLAVFPLLIVAALIVFAYRGYLRLTTRFGALQQLYDFGRSLGGPDEEPREVVWAVLERVQSVMRASRAEILLATEWPSGRRVALQDEYRSIEEAVPLDSSRPIAEVLLEDHVSLRLRREEPAAEQPSDPVMGTFRDALITPLTSGDRVFGALVALDRQEDLDPFDDDDLRLFEALGAHASTMLERARLVEELRLEAESKSHQAMHDLLTGLPNRLLFLERATAALHETGRAAVAILDLDRFKEVNDTLGHETGDKLLCEVAECLVRAAHGRATVARLGGDEFAVIVTDIIGQEEAIGIVRDLETALTQPMLVEGITLAVRASAGVALSPEHGNNVSTLLQRADIAMYLAKEKRSGLELYSPSQDQNMQRKLVLGGQLAQALTHRAGLHVVYQPIALLSDGELVRVEALARWDHPEFGQVPADEFIAIAAQMGLIGEITDFVLSQACTEAAKWRDAGMPIGVSVNLSGRDLTEISIVDKVAAQLAAHGLAPNALTLEVTETEVMADLGQASNVLSQLGAMGVRVAVDDYGTGYSSLAYLHRLPLTELKIDRSFITNMVLDQSNAIIVRSSIMMAHSLGLSVVAEGAEDELTCAVLADAGCDAVQGYYLARPLSASTLREWLATRPRLHFSRELPPPLRIISGQLQVPRTGQEGMGQMGG